MDETSSITSTRVLPYMSSKEVLYIRFAGFTRYPLDCESWTDFSVLIARLGRYLGASRVGRSASSRVVPHGILAVASTDSGVIRIGYPMGTLFWQLPVVMELDGPWWGPIADRPAYPYRWFPVNRFR